MCKKCVLALLFGLTLLSATACIKTSGPSPEIINGTPVAVTKILGAFHAIEGTHYQLAAISTDQSASGSRYDLSELFSYGRSNYSVYNYVFLDVDAETVHALLPTNDDAILSIQGYPVPDPASTSTEKVPVAWWLYTIVKEDTNKDSELSFRDSQTLAISDVGGNGYTEIIPGVDEMLANTLKNETTLLIIYRSSDKNYLAHIDLPSRAVIKSKELPSFGENVK